MTQVETYATADTDFSALSPGTELLNGQYRIDSYLSSGGFGITYLATDSLGRQVVIKECFPEALCRRANQTVLTKTSRSVGEFNALVEMFVREAKSLAKLEHPNIVGVHQIFQANDTAYMVLDFIDGRDAMQLLEQDPEPMSPDRVVALAGRLLDAISAVHGADMLHRDISPDNILIDRNGAPCLIDFGAARQEATKKSRAISALMVVKDGYSPQEFYISGGQQGPASDLYSLGATLYHMITGEAPPNSQNRLAALAAKKPDPYQPLVSRVPGYPPNFLRAIDMAMNVFPKDRPQSAEHWAAIMSGQTGGPGNEDGHVRRVVSDLVNEVAKSLAKEAETKARQAEEEARQAEAEALAALVAQQQAEVAAAAEALEDIDPTEALCGGDLEATEDTGEEMAELNHVAELPPKAPYDPIAAVAARAARRAQGEIASRDQIIQADAFVDPYEEYEAQAEVTRPTKSKRTRRRISALVLIATLVLVFEEIVSEYQFGETLTEVGSFIGAVMADEARI